MKNKHVCKFISLFMLVFVLFSAIPIHVFAEAESSNPQREEEYTFWEDLGFVLILLLGAILSPIIALAKGIEFLVLAVAEFFASIF